SIPFNPNWLVFREASYKSVLGYQKKDFEGVIKAIGEGKIKPAPMITSRIQMDRLVDDGYWALIKEKDKHVKILVDMRAGLSDTAKVVSSSSRLEDGAQMFLVCRPWPGVQGARAVWEVW
ncbi:hypothetical protein LTS09_017759, partial [Friedmanniomyces endolithicus]